MKVGTGGRLKGKTVHNRLRKKVDQFVARLRGWKTFHVFGETLRFDWRSRVFDFEFCPSPRETVSTDYVVYVNYVQMRSVVQGLKDVEGVPVVVDVGAYHGEYAVLMGKLIRARGGKVLAIEPDVENFSVLRQNVRLNDLEETVMCERVAVTDRSGVCGWRSQDSQSAVAEVSGGGREAVETVRLSELLKRHGIDRVDILMIDTEGAELLVLRGAPEWGTRAPKIFCEMHPYAWREFGYTGAEVSAFLQDRGLQCVDMFMRRHGAFEDERFYIGPTLLFHGCRGSRH